MQISAKSYVDRCKRELSTVINDEKTCVIYHIPYEDHSSVYIGETGRKLRTYKSIAPIANSPVSAHTKSGNIIDWDCVKKSWLWLNHRIINQFYWTSKICAQDIFVDISGQNWFCVHVHSSTTRQAGSFPSIIGGFYVDIWILPKALLKATIWSISSNTGWWKKVASKCCSTSHNLIIPLILP